MFGGRNHASVVELPPYTAMTGILNACAPSTEDILERADVVCVVQQKQWSTTKRHWGYCRTLKVEVMKLQQEYVT